MDFLYNAFLLIHILSWAFMLGSWLATMNKPGLAKGFPHAALTALVTGLTMFVLKEMEDGDAQVSHMKIGIKLLVNLVVVVLAFRAQKKGADAPKGLITAIGGLTIVNIIVAVFVSGAHGL